jgi:hypothetical protein
MADIDLSNGYQNVARDMVKFAISKVPRGAKNAKAQNCELQQKFSEFTSWHALLKKPHPKVVKHVIR